MIKNGWKLVKKDGSDIDESRVVQDFRGDAAVIVDCDPPHHQGSTGRVHVRHIDAETGELVSKTLWSYYPSVYNLKWIKE